MHAIILFISLVPSSAPENLTGEALSSEEVFFTWDLPAPQHQNGIIIGYIINITALETGATIHMSTPYKNVTLHSLRPFTTYSCIVAARTSVGLGPFSTTVTAQTLEDGMNHVTLSSFYQPYNNIMLFSPIKSSIKFNWLCTEFNPYLSQLGSSPTRRNQWSDQGIPYQHHRGRNWHSSPAHSTT